MSNKYFYKDLPEYENLNIIFDETNYEKLPNEWFVLVTDIKNSTIAIEKGRYKDVNMVGALCIISILNIDLELDIPFVFGGDGAFILIPPEIAKKGKQSLLAIKNMSKKSFDLDLRIGIVPIKDIYNKNKSILITKYKISKDYSQAIIKGGGLDFCDELLKTSEKYLINESIDKNFEVNIEGLECRWEAMKSPKDETLAILIKSVDDKYYNEILMNLEEILGNTHRRHPILKKNMKLSFSNDNLQTEASLYSQNFFMKNLVMLKLKFINLLGKLLIDFNIGEWVNYKSRIVSTTDTEKFDDMLRLIVSADFAQTKQLEEYLEKEYKDKKIFYGIHKADSSLMTCLIFERHGKHVHFVDANNGGYAMAAKMYKKQIKGI